MLVIVLVGIGGAIGSVARYLISAWFQRRSRSGFPWGTALVNFTGSLLIGLVFGLFDGGLYSSDSLTVLVSGLLGGYTTFSTFSLENLNLLNQRRFRWLLINTSGQVTGGLLLVIIGYSLGSAVG